ncbi:hypothetical protein IWQ60_011090 [Tieghemiomyces parasiticus]|uniref:F-box domain-containing protein n=1 Tax=Tieghemiomyces parasiticus TaxID=78921 RepID=A0A9W7ZI03_9FUNG|nr:hypothetical protein IWQ60_011090 [Tieghemiomyces parasiticus]
MVHAPGSPTAPPAGASATAAYHLLLLCLDNFGDYFAQELSKENLGALRLVNRAVSTRVSRHLLSQQYLNYPVLNDPDHFHTFRTVVEPYNAMVTRLQCRLRLPWTYRAAAALKDHLRSLTNLRNLTIEYRVGFTMPDLNDLLLCVTPRLEGLYLVRRFQPLPHVDQAGGLASRPIVPRHPSVGDPLERLLDNVPMAGIRHLHNLRRFVALRHYGFTDDVHAAIYRACPKLVSATFDDALITDVALQTLVRRPNHARLFKRLDFINCSHVTDVGIIKALKHSPRLLCLTVSQCDRVTGRFLDPLVPHWLPRLYQLKISGVDHLPELGFSPLSFHRVFRYPWPQLQAIDFRKVQLDDAGLAALVASCTRLRRIALIKCDLILASYPLLFTRCPHLEYVDLRPSHHRMLRTTDYLQGPVVCYKLTTLLLNGPALQPAPFFEYLSALPRLKELTLVGTEHNAEFARLEAAYPAVKVTFGR